MAPHPPTEGPAARDAFDPHGGQNTPRDPVDWLATPWNTGGMPVVPEKPDPRQGAGLPVTPPGDPTPWNTANMPVTSGQMTPWDAGVPRDVSPPDAGLPSWDGSGAADPATDAYRPPDPAVPPYGAGDDPMSRTRLDVGPTMNARGDAASLHGTGDSGPVAGAGDAATYPFNVLDDAGPAFGAGWPDQRKARADDDDDGMRYPLFEDEDEGGMRYPGIRPSTGDGTGRRSGRSLRTPIAAGIIVAALVGGIVLYGALHDSKPGSQTSGSSGSSGAPAPNTGRSGPASQAVAVNAILQSGTDSHDKLAVPMSTCADLSAAVPVFQQVAQDRGVELARSRQVQVDALPHGSDLRKAMADTYANSLDADRSYLAWAQEVKAKNCGKADAPQTPRYAAVLAANAKARAAKRRVVSLWTPIAQSQNLPVYTWDQL